MQRIKIEKLKQKLKQLQLDNEIKKLKQKSIYTTGQVSQPCYTEGNNSPTESDFIDPQLRVLTKSSFIPNYNELNNEMLSVKNTHKYQSIGKPTRKKKSWTFIMSGKK